MVLYYFNSFIVLCRRHPKLRRRLLMRQRSYRFIGSCSAIQLIGCIIIMRQRTYSDHWVLTAMVDVALIYVSKQTWSYKCYLCKLHLVVRLLSYSFPRRILHYALRHAERYSERYADLYAYFSPLSKRPSARRMLKPRRKQPKKRCTVNTAYSTCLQLLSLFSQHMYAAAEAETGERRCHHGAATRRLLGHLRALPTYNIYKSACLYAY